MAISKSNDLSSLFEPRSVAIIGSIEERRLFDRPLFGGYLLLNNLLDCGFAGKIYLVNPSYEEFRSIKVYSSIKNIPESVDLAFIVAPPRIVPSILKDCAEKCVKAAIIGSDGFAERDEEGVKLQKEVVAISKQTGIRVLGPNTLGVLNTMNGLATSPYYIGSKSNNKFRVERGNVSLAAQTGLITPQGFPYKDLSYGINKICDFGNKCDVDESDLLEYLADDSETKVIAMEIEGIKNGRRLLNMARKVVKEKPILVFKPGRTKESEKALVSHTGSLASNKRVYEAAFKQAGIIQVDSFRELIEIAKAFSHQPLPKGNRLGIVTITGEAGIETIDNAIESGLVISKLSTETNEKLFDIHPTLANNPSDIGPAMIILGEAPYRDVTETMLNDKNVDCVLCTFWSSIPINYYIDFLNKIKNPENKPIILWIYGPDKEIINQTCLKLENNGHTIYSDLRIALKALGAMYQYAKIKNKFKENCHREF